MENVRAKRGNRDLTFKTYIMLNQKIKTYKGGRYETKDLFILSKGMNSGKPLEKPCPNCFICHCDSIQEKQRIYWLLYALWQGKKFHESLVGSVIPFIRKKDLIKLLEVGLKSTLEQPCQIEEIFKKLQTVKQQELNYIKIQSSLAQLKCVLANQIINN
ncbi:MAG: hypothetical protein COA32_05760 [Fluviicola sp.]|nr:MAG: hypothetical protein COA32_05760 [Fluviicola sp.]